MDKVAKHPFYEARKKAGIGEEKFAEMLGIKLKNLRRFENGTLVPSKRTIIKAAKVLNWAQDALGRAIEDWEREFIQHAWRVKL